MTYFFQCSKVFALFAEVEAGPRAVAEAFKTGLAFARLFAVRDIPFAGTLLNTDNLNPPVSGHYQAVPWRVDKDTTVDIQSKRQFDIFKGELPEGPQAASDPRKAAW